MAEHEQAQGEAVVVVPAVVYTPTPEPLIPSGESLEPEFDYDAEFDAQVARNEAKKKSNSGEVAESVDAPETPADAAPEKPAQAAAQAAVDPDEAFVALLPEDKREAARARFKAAGEAEARAKKLEHDNRSLSGRMSAYQRKYEEAAGKRAVETPAQPKVADSAEWTQFATDYPDVAKGIEARLAATQPGINPDVEQMVEFVKEERRTRFLKEAWDAVEEVHAGWRTQAQTKEFQEWKASSPTYEKLASSDDVADAIALFDLYDAFTLKSKPAAPAIDPAKAAEAAKLAARRGAQVDGARAQTTTSASPNQNLDMADPEQLFAMYAKKSNARMAGRNR